MNKATKGAARTLVGLASAWLVGLAAYVVWWVLKGLPGELTERGVALVAFCVLAACICIAGASGLIALFPKLFKASAATHAKAVEVNTVVAVAVALGAAAGGWYLSRAGTLGDLVPWMWSGAAMIALPCAANALLLHALRRS